MKQKYILFIVFTLFAVKGNAQTSYAVNSIPFQQYSGSLTPLMTTDDLYSPVIALPFSFDFYGNSYNQIVVSTNGYIDFRTNLAGQYSPWNITYTLPNANFGVLNSIFGCYEDLNNPNGTGTITYGSYGTAPYRKFVVSFTNQPHFQCNTTAISTFQMVLSETSNTIDVNIQSRQSCTTWNGGKGVVGLVNADGTIAITPPGRNTGAWTANNESWRFSRPGYFQTYNFVKCDDGSSEDFDGAQVFDLSIAAIGIAPSNPSGVSFFSDIALTMPIANPTAFENANNPQTIYAAGNGIMKEVKLEVVDCSIDADNDMVSTNEEDINSDGNLANDDTDFDGIPNYIDNDDDGDLVLTSVEYVFSKANATTVNALLDTDNDGIPNYLDNDDDGDGLATALEDYNGDGNPTNDDTNSNSLPDYLEFGVALGVQENMVNAVDLFPNPASSELNIQALNGELISNIAIYSVNGSLVKEVKANNNYHTVSVSELQSGMYFIKVTANDRVSNLKFIKQ